MPCKLEKKTQEVIVTQNSERYSKVRHSLTDTQLLYTCFMSDPTSFIFLVCEDFIVSSYLSWMDA